MAVLKKFKNIIVRTPASSMVNGISSGLYNQTPVDYELAKKQHLAYIEALKEAGLEVFVADKLEDFPDSCFVEDAAVIVPGRELAILTNPGASTRNGEKEFMLPILKKFFPDEKIKKIESPGTLDGGDVMMVGDTYFVGMSERTNDEGIRQFHNILAKIGKKVVPVPMTEMLHLKTGVNYLEHNNLLISGEFLEYPTFKDFNQVVVDAPGEEYAANCIWVNDTVIVPKGYPTILAKVKSLKKSDGKPYKVVECDTSEYKKLDGGLSCLSLRF
ncbi:dimethylarginine dimethylaminohydrolase family protein [Mycoplasma sp. Mirounga ES2805-ORL]|uniref:dimethylarginine dimethylaminohydrolase family protein n=1 Tax=Mycoplasma sp. Mirounga ES2805-ORL TaxID=754514 RepID=UPI00197C58C8|nr:arginine deiminase family protein [Mycoplasma sp. Mirounga ES2805-ORL]QSF13791.1 N(G),N(G)-dimethylarginine dimethylaminohydrolase [Mycoplasma sp. Mirounga ES2805-ORL]